MTINATATSSNALSVTNNNAANSLRSTSSSVSTSSSELAEDEKKYDLDNDGTLSITEKAAMDEAKSKAQILEAGKSNNSSVSDSFSLSISQEGLKMQKQAPPEPPTAEMLAKMKGRANPPAQNEEQKLMNDAISEYKKFSPENYLNTAG